MKLWRVVQWGNPSEGSKGHDTQCIISAVSLEKAVEKAKECFADWQNGQADIVFLLGKDKRPEGPPVVVVPKWVAPSYNLGVDANWRRTPAGKWVGGALFYEAELT